MYIDKFCEYLDLERNYSDRTIQSYRKDLELFESFFLGIDRQLDFCTIDRDIVRSWTAAMKKMGGLGSILSMMPGMGIKASDMDTEEGEIKMKRTEAIVLSMTKEERANPKLMNPRRKLRIAKGAGVDISEVNRFIKQFEQAQKMMKQLPGMMGRKGKFPKMGGFPF